MTAVRRRQRKGEPHPYETAAELVEARLDWQSRGIGVRPPVPGALLRLLSERIREAREAAGLTQAEIERQGGPNKQEIWAAEAGTRTFSLGMLAIYAHLTGKPIWWFLYEQPTPGEGERSPTKDRWRGAGGRRRTGNDHRLPNIGQAPEEEAP